MPSATRGKYSAKEVRLNPSLLNKTSSTKSSSSSVSSGAPKAPKTGDFKFDSSKLVPTYQAEAASIYSPQIQQIQGLQALTKAQSEDAKTKTKDEFAQLLKREQENINRRGAFFSGGAIDQENRIGAQEGGALRDIGFQEQSANLQYQGTLSEIAQAQKDYVSSKVEGAYSSAYKTFQDKIANQMSQYQMELGQYNTDRSFNQSVKESDRNYALSAAASGRAGANQAQTNLENLLARAAQKGEGGREWAVANAKTFGVNPDDVIRATYGTKDQPVDNWEAMYRDPAATTKLTGTQQNAVSDANAAIETAKLVKEQAKNVNTGFISGKIGKVAQVAGQASENFVELNSNVEKLRADFTKAISGAAVSEPEAKRLREFLPSVSDSEEDIQIKLDSLIEGLERSKNAVYEVAGVQNVNAPMGNTTMKAWDINGNAVLVSPEEMQSGNYKPR